MSGVAAVASTNHRRLPVTLSSCSLWGVSVGSTRYSEPIEWHGTSRKLSGSCEEVDELLYGTGQPSSQGPVLHRWSPSHSVCGDEAGQVTDITQYEKI